jgi:hypothetical protein
MGFNSIAIQKRLDICSTVDCMTLRSSKNSASVMLPKCRRSANSPLKSAAGR